MSSIKKRIRVIGLREPPSLSGIPVTATAGVAVGTVVVPVGDAVPVGVGHEPRQFGEGTAVTGVAVAAGAVVAVGAVAVAAVTMTVPCINV